MKFDLELTVNDNEITDAYNYLVKMMPKVNDEYVVETTIEGKIVTVDLKDERFNNPAVSSKTWEEMDITVAEDIKLSIIEWAKKMKLAREV